MTVVAKRFSGTVASRLAVQPAYTPLPAGLVISPGFYTYGGQNYDCSQEGLYRFWQPMTDTQQRIIWKSDVDALMSAIAWICVNGRADEALALSAKTTQALTSKLRLLCGKTTEWAKYLTDSANIALTTRTVRALTGTTPGGYYDGHVMLEVKVGGQWVLYDLANSLTYANAAGGKALKDVVPLTDAVVRSPIADNVYSIEPFGGSGSFDVTAWQELTMADPGDFLSELERVLQIPGIQASDGLTYFYLPAGLESRSSWVTSLDANYRILPQADWLTKFYS